MANRHELGPLYTFEDYDKPDVLEDIEHSNRRLRTLDLGPRNDIPDNNFGPTTQAEAQAFDDCASSKYIDTRPSTGIHCMDDRNLLPGIQLPGGLFETQIASRLIDHTWPRQSVSVYYDRISRDFNCRGEPLWVHAGCAAMSGKRKGLEAVYTHCDSAFEFTGNIMEEMKLPFDEDYVKTATLEANIVATKAWPWDLAAEESLEFCKRQRGVNYEEFAGGHKAAGMAIITSPERFNNRRFMYDNQIGLFVVTMGAYKEYLRSVGFGGDRLSNEIVHASLFTFGMAKVAGHDYLPVGILDYQR